MMPLCLGGHKVLSTNIINRREGFGLNEDPGEVWNELAQVKTTGYG
jgi:hypothetical protein